MSSAEKKSSAAPLSPAARGYVSVVAAVGITLGLYCVYSLWRDGVPVELLVFSALTLLSGRITLKVPSVAAHLTASEMFTFTCVLLFGPAAGAITLAIDSVVLGWQRRMTPMQMLFNFGNLTLSVWVAGTLFFLTAGVTPLFNNHVPVSGLVVPLGVLAATYFLINSGLTAAAIGMATSRSPLQVWRQHCLWIGPGYAAGACVALLLIVALRQVHFTALLLILPLLLVFYYSLRSTLGRDEDAKGHVVALNRLYLSTVETLATAIDAKDEVTHGHVRRVQVAAVGLAREVGITDEPTLKALEAAALLHDTGKIAVPEHILNKPGKLTAAEFEKMKRHAPIGAEILSAIEFPYPVVPMVRHHHENWDGTGYPDRIKGLDIPIGARILAVVDCFDALTSDRPYRKRMTNEAAVAILLERRGTMYDPIIVDTFLRTYERFMPTANETAHPVAHAIGEARASLSQAEAPGPALAATAAAGAETVVTGEVLAIASLARAIAGEASLSDVGALTWMMLRHAVPCASMALYVYDKLEDSVTADYTDGLHSGAIRGKRIPLGGGVAGWAAANRRFVLNADPALDLGEAAALTPALRSSITIPLCHDSSVTAVLSLYSTAADAFTDDQARLLTLLAPSLASSLAAVPKADAWAQPAAEPRRPAAGEMMRLVRR